MFLPFVVGSHRGFGKETEEILNYIAARKCFKEDVNFGVALERLRVKISIAVQKSQSNAILLCYGDDGVISDEEID